MITLAFMRLIIICKPWSLFQMAKEMNVPELLRRIRMLQQNGIKEIIFKFSKVVSVTPPDLTHTVAILMHHSLIALIFPCDLTCFESRFFKSLFHQSYYSFFLISSLEDFRLRKFSFKNPCYHISFKHASFGIFNYFHGFLDFQQAQINFMVLNNRTG